MERKVERPYNGREKRSKKPRDDTMVEDDGDSAAAWDVGGNASNLAHPPRAPGFDFLAANEPASCDDPHGVVGRHVVQQTAAGNFGGPATNTGVVVFAYLPLRGAPLMYRLRYQNGESEDLNLAEVTPLLAEEDEELEDQPEFEQETDLGAMIGTPATSGAAAEAVKRFADFVSDLADETEEVAAARMQEDWSGVGSDGGVTALTAAAAATAGAGGGLSREQLSRAYQEVALLGAAVGVTAADLEHLRLLLRLLTRSIRGGSSANALKLALRGESRAAAAALEAADAAMEAAAAALTVMATPGLDRRLVEDEVVEDCVTLVRHHFASHVAHAFAPDVLAAVAAAATADGGSASSTSSKQALERLRPHCRRVLQGLGGRGGAYEVLERLQALVSAVTLDDAFLLHLCQTCSSVLAMDCSASDADRQKLRPLHLLAMSLLHAAFGRYPEHRTVILEDVFGLWVKLPPPGKKGGGVYSVRLSAALSDDGIIAATAQHSAAGHVAAGRAVAPQVTVHTVTALVMLLVQSCVRRPPPAPAATALLPEVNDTDGGGGSRSGGVEGGSSHGEGAGLAPAARIAGFFVQGLLGRCAKKEQGQAFRPLLGPFIEDLMAAVALPEWPGAELLLESMRRALFSQLQTFKDSSGSLEAPYALAALDAAGRIAARVAALRAAERERPTRLPAPSEVPEFPAQEPPGGADGKEQVACVCGGAIGSDVFMLDCDRCHRWFHGTCVGVAGQNDAPKEWFCSECTMLRQVSLQRAALRERRRVAASPIAPAKTGKQRCNSSGGGNGDGTAAAATAAGEDAAAAAAAADEGELATAASVDTDGVEEAPESAVLRQLLLNDLTPRARQDPWCTQARRVHLARWMDEAATAVETAMEIAAVAAAADAWAHFKDQWEVPDETVRRRPWEELALPANASAALSRHLLLRRELCDGGGFDAMLLRLLSLTGLGAANMRTRVMRAVGGVVTADPSLMTREDVRRAVAARFRDVSIAVRQAAVELVGELILGAGADGPRLLDAYYGELMERLVDCGVSVRKTVVKILRAALLAWPTHSRRAHACQALVERAGVVKEEDTIRDLIRDTFQDIWFKQADAGRPAAVSVAAAAACCAANGAAAAAGDGEEDAWATAEQPASLTPEQALHAAALQMVEVVGGVKNTEWLVKMLEGMLFGPGEGDKGRKDDAKKRAAAAKHSRRLVDCLVKMLLKVDDGKYPLPLSRAPAGQQLLAIIATLHVFSRASPALLVPHMGSLYPYLAGQNGVGALEEGAIVLMVSGMTYHVLPLLDRPDLAVMKRVVSDLMRATLRSGVKPIQSAVRCLGRLVEVVTKDPAPVHALFRRFYGFLYKRSGQQGGGVGPAPGEGPDVRASIRRGLVVLGCLCQHFSFGDAAVAAVISVDGEEDCTNAAAEAAEVAAAAARAARERDAAAEEEEDIELPGIAPMDCRAPRVVYEMLRRFIECGDAELQSSALTGLSSLLSGAPRLSLVAQRHGLVDYVLSDDVAPAVLCQAVANLRAVLLAEEERVESGQARERMALAGVTAAARVQGDQDAESSAVGSVLQLHVGTLLQRLLHPAADVRHAAALLAGTLLRQGLVNPLEAMPHLIALQADQEADVRAEALRSVLVEDEKGRDFLRPRLLDGICLAYAFQRLVFGAARPLLPPSGPDSGATALLGPIYGSCIRGNRQARFGCLKQLLSLFNGRKAAEVRAHLRVARERAAGHGDGSSNSSSGGGSFGFGASSGRGSGVAAGQAAAPAVPLPLGLLEFVCGTLAYLPYDTQEEALFIVHHVNRHVSVHGGLGRDALHRALERCGAVSASSLRIKSPTAGKGKDGSRRASASGDGDENDMVVAAINGDGSRSSADAVAAVAAAANGPAAGNGTTAPPPAAAEADLESAACAVAAMSMLVGLKHFLKSAYGLTDTRCQSYDPGEGTKATERPACRPEAMPDFELPVAAIALTEWFEDREAPANLAAGGGGGGGGSGYGGSGNGIVKRELAERALRCYKEFKALMKGDPPDYLVAAAAAAAEAGNGAATPKSGRKSGGGSRKSTGTRSSAKGRKRAAAEALEGQPPAAAAAGGSSGGSGGCSGKAGNAASSRQRKARKKQRFSDVPDTDDEEVVGANGGGDDTGDERYRG